MPDYPPGLYFVRSTPAIVLLISEYRPGRGWYDSDFEVWQDNPPGTIESGPHTPEQLLTAVGPMRRLDSASQAG